MNSEKQKRNIERLYFRQLKREEKNKKINSDDFLKTSDFKFIKFSNDGDSGNLLIAINKNNEDEKYIVKHEYYDCACNEYMYYKIASKLDVNVAPVKLFIVNNNKSLFKSDFVCGVKYLENSKSLKTKDLIDNKKFRKQYVKMIALESILDESDGMEILKSDNKIYRIDTTSSFNISHFQIYPMAYMNKNEEIKNIVNKSIYRLAQNNTQYRTSLWEYNLKNIIEKFGEDYSDIYLKEFIGLKKINNSNIKEWIDNINYIYPNLVGKYYELYLDNLKKDIDYFLSNIYKKNKTKTKKY